VILAWTAGFGIPFAGSSSGKEAPMFDLSFRKALGLVGAIVLLALPAAAAAQTADELTEDARQFVQYGDAVIAITGVQVVDGTGAAPRSGQTVVIADRRIQSLGADGDVAIPEGARQIDGSGHTVIPGLIGIHNHTFYTTAARHSQMNTTSPRLYLAAGVTTIRTTGSYSPYSEINMRRAIDAGEIVGPRMHITGPYISGAGASTYMTQVNSPEDARRVVAYWAEEGATWFKAYTRISRAELGAAIEEAHKHGLKFTAHLCSVTFREAVDLAIDSLEHGFFTNTEYHADKEPDECPPSGLAELHGHHTQPAAVMAGPRPAVVKGLWHGRSRWVGHAGDTMQGVRQAWAGRHRCAAGERSRRRSVCGECLEPHGGQALELLVARVDLDAG